jgi:CRP/FNR family transcriptional regulator
MYKFNNLDSLFEPALVKEINESGKLMHFKDGGIVLDYGKYIPMFPVVLDGTLKVLKNNETGKEIFLYYLSGNESCPLAYNCCLEEKKSEVRAIAEGDLEILMIPQDKLNDWLRNYPSWKIYIMRTLNERFMELFKTIESIAFDKLDDRLITYLKEKQQLYGSNVIKASHYLIAEELAASRVAVSRLLKILEDKGKILLYPHEIKLLKGFEL